MLQFKREMNSVKALILCLFLSAIVPASASDPLAQNMSPNEKTTIGDIEFDVFRMQSAEPDRAAYPLDRHKVTIGNDGRLYSSKSFSNEKVPASTQLLTYSAKFIVDTSGQLYVFHNANALSSDADTAFLYSEPELLAAGNIVIHDGKILAMSPMKVSGMPDERAIIRYLRLLRKKGYDDFPLHVSDYGDTFKEILDFYRRNALNREFYPMFLKQFSRNLEDVNFNMAPREANCRSGLQGGNSKGRLFKL